MEKFRNRENQGYFKKTRADRSLWRYMLGFEGKEYRAWTDEFKLHPAYFDSVEWECFKIVFKAISGDEKFNQSSEYLTYKELCEFDARNREKELFDVFKDHRRAEYLQWAQSYMALDSLISQRAITVVEAVMDNLCNELFDAFVAVGREEKVIEVKYAEQLIHEAKSAVIDDALSFTELDICENIYEHYVRALVGSMLEVPQFRKGMMEYAGLVKRQYKKKLVVKDDFKSESKEWFDNFFSNQMEAEKAESKDDVKVNAAITIQRLVRGRRGRAAVRKIVAKTFIKQYDAASRASYYVNLKTGESSWTRPLILKYIYKNSNW